MGLRVRFCRHGLGTETSVINGLALISMAFFGPNHFQLPCDRKEIISGDEQVR